MKIDGVIAKYHLDTAAPKPNEQPPNGRLRSLSVKDSVLPGTHYTNLHKNPAMFGVKGFPMEELMKLNKVFAEEFATRPSKIQAWHDLKGPIVSLGTLHSDPVKFNRLSTQSLMSVLSLDGADKLNLSEKMALELYRLDADYYRELNKQLRENGSVKSGWEFFEARLKDALDTLREGKPNVVTFRGVKDAPQFTDLKRGDTYENKEFLSSTQFVDITKRYVHADIYLTQKEIIPANLPIVDTSNDSLLVLVNGQKGTIDFDDKCGAEYSEEIALPGQQWNVELNVRHPHPSTKRDVNWVVLGDASNPKGHQPGLVDALDLAKKV